MVAEEGVVGAEIGFVGELELRSLFSGGARVDLSGVERSSEKRTAVFGELEGLDEDGAPPAGLGITLGVKDVPPLGAVGGFDETRMADAEGFLGGLEDGTFAFFPGSGIERIVAGEFELAEFVAGKPGGAAGIDDDRCSRRF